jgi:hypothetical protein
LVAYSFCVLPPARPGRTHDVSAGGCTGEAARIS